MVATAIKDIRAGARKIDVSGQITAVEEARETKGGQKVAKATLYDGTGSIELSVWDADIAKISVGKKVTVENGYADSYKGKLQLSSGKYGKLKVE